MDLEACSVDDLIDGYTIGGDFYECALCGKKFSTDEVFPVEGKFYNAEKAVKLHVETAHPGRILDLISGESKYLSLTDKQKELFILFAQGRGDAEIAKTLKITASTVRHQRFVFKEKAKSAKLYLALWELTQRHAASSDKLIDIHGGAKMIDDRYVITEEENRKIIENVFLSESPLKLKVFSPKEKKKIVILRRIIKEFEKGRKYKEKEVNEILKSIYEDYATIRRYLYEYGYMERTRDCSEYWVK